MTGHAVVAALLVGGHLALAQNPNPMDSIRRLPGYRPAADTTQYLALDRINRLVPAKQRAAWVAYVAASRARYTRDTSAMRAELHAAGMKAMTRAPYAHGFAVDDHMTPAWFAGDSARWMTAAILSFHAPNGGWSKHVDFARERAPGESFFAESSDWEWISTIDNGATTEEVRFLALADRARPDPRNGRAIVRAIDYLMSSQMPNGCFPQVYPLEGSYHDAATFNDNATANVLRLLDDVAAGRLAATASDARRRSTARTAVDRGIACVLDAQVTTRGKLTAWGQQHDPLTLAPVSARSYELVSLSSLESAGLLDFLMTLPAPNPRVVAAVYAAADWLEASSMHGYTYESYVLEPHPGAGPIWGRLYELETNRVIMANREGIKLYDWNQLTDRRTGYGWYTTKPAETLATFKRWSATHRRPA